MSSAWELFEQGLGPRAAHSAVARKASYGTVAAIHHEWQARRADALVQEAPPQPVLPLPASDEQRADEASVATGPAESKPVMPVREPPLDEVMPSAGSVVQHVGAWLLLGMLHKLGF